MSLFLFLFFYVDMLTIMFSFSLITNFFLSVRFVSSFPYSWLTRDLFVNDQMSRKKLPFLDWNISFLSLPLFSAKLSIQRLEKVIILSKLEQLANQLFVSEMIDINLHYYILSWSVDYLSDLITALFRPTNKYMYFITHKQKWE